MNKFCPVIVRERVATSTLQGHFYQYIFRFIYCIVFKDCEDLHVWYRLLDMNFMNTRIVRPEYHVSQDFGQNQRTQNDTSTILGKQGNSEKEPTNSHLPPQTKTFDTRKHLCKKVCVKHTKLKFSKGYYTFCLITYLSLHI